MFKLKSEVQFDMAHYLSGYNGKCSNIHGHRYRLIAKIGSETLHECGQCRGMVDDFSNFKNALKNIEETFDHKLVIEDNDEGRALSEKLKELPNNFDIYFVNYRPTAEEMSRDIFNRLKDMGLSVCEVELFETPNNSCIYSE
ncbi:6-pyruvoyl trahydropterin synthase family protein [Clostridium butyricum]|jgi:6-pyruvoyltetrahydropterin/6-carboxytetrahydropterin synthase|uniref:6-carboxy-5,6,7,8-tetrahydropterin synthase n=1 Tax=Clostridium butyricum TaxID=1492 RepID=A0A2S7F9M6_CLOBU|nr:6-carboxytetrahydropterin synthase [Clostridium butyricum]ETI90676.1 MAG: 6-pyruvoyl tetrahydropterin synthase/QueD family protein [Clostridium butyricum DORA_1]KHD16552.1 6-pyruvoyl tetrahydrobiopterin synthase [Clostridium butyricum]MBS5981766.1 6-carboxytetrahydropterin synthase [Clostridium butyricum]MBZ5746687.1 6-carboxytetrahydropterin synthase [Clostridium butyricum]MDU1507306.1 6-carboxytetrahydropterin synthase [Clostridium butyricum]